MVEQELELAVPLPTDTAQLNEPNSHSRTSPSSYQRTETGDVGDSVASATTDLSELQISNAAEDHRLDPDSLWPEDSSLADKEKWLKALFPTIESVQIEETIGRSGGDPQKCVDELLNLSFITSNPIDTIPESKPVPKGVDGFAAAHDDVSRTRKGKSRKKNRQYNTIDDTYLSDGTLSSGATTPNRNIWHTAAADVDFISSRTQMSVISIKSIYHENGANLAQTLRTLIIKEAESNADEIRSNDILQIQVAELKHNFAETPDPYVYGALILAKMLPSAAKDLLEAMTAKCEDVHRPTKLVAQYTPVNLSDEEPTKKKHVASPFVSSSADPAILVGRAGAQRDYAHRAFEQASASFRRGKSNPAYGGAAAYYASVGHERRKKEKELLTLAADAWVSQQSTSDGIDLHGVNVEHAVRIALSSVAKWWEDLGDKKYVLGGTRDGYRIITGVGTHSAQGIGRIGPAVSKALMREGWKINVQRGEIFVEGRTKRA